MSTENRTLLGARLREERDRLGFTQEDFAALGDVKKRTLQDWERGLASPSSDFLATVSSNGVDVFFVLTGDRKPPPQPDNFLLCMDEPEMLLNFRSLHEEMKKSISALISAAARRQ